MINIYQQVSQQCSELTTRAYSTSFSIGVRCLKKELRWAIYSLYGFVRFADEIVDTFHDFDKQTLFDEFCRDTWNAIERKISLNPILNSFQEVVHRYEIDRSLISRFLESMEADLHKSVYENRDEYGSYIVGSAEVVGLMCLKVFTENNDADYESLKEPARRLGAAFQKVNFLRDMKDDHELLGRMYFPGVDFGSFDEQQKAAIEKDIEDDFHQAFKGIMKLNKGVRFGVYVAFIYYKALFNKIKRLTPHNIKVARIRISNPRKLALLLGSYITHTFGINKQYSF